MKSLIKEPLAIRLAAILMIFIFSGSCSRTFRTNYDSVNAMIHGVEDQDRKVYLKAHLKNGDVAIFSDTWGVDSTKEIIYGHGSLYNYNRKLKMRDNLTVEFDDIALLETNKKLIAETIIKLSTLGILTGMNVAITIACIANPKTCFGSCPTFYREEAGNVHYSDAEGFSNAVLPSLEYGDIDALGTAISENGEFSIIMKNEAPETHCVNEVNVLAYPIRKGERVFHNREGEFFLCEGLIPPSRATGPEGDITELLAEDDKIERYSNPDAQNMKSREEIYLEFPADPGNSSPGLVITFRQSLMTSFITYNSMNYMGPFVSDIFAEVEKKPDLMDKLYSGVFKELGDIEVYQFDHETSSWVFTGGWHETGPIALNDQILPLKKGENQKEVKVKIVLNKGLWRLDRLNLVRIKESVEPEIIKPFKALKSGNIDYSGLKKLNSPDKHLVSMPGDHFNFFYHLPEKNTEYEVFLYSKGYYLVWIRDHWLTRSDIPKLYELLYKPSQYLENEAARYHAYESIMEEQFWNSRITPENYSYHEKD